MAHNGRGTCNSELGNLAGAINDFDVAILLAPDEADHHYNRALTYAAMEERQQAVEHLAGPSNSSPASPADAH